MSKAQEYHTSHRAHDYKFLIKRWRSVARAGGLRLKEFFRDGDYPHYFLEPTKPRDGQSFYLSAGIHGDEPASPQGLLRWAEQNPGMVRSANLLIFPCLNPWGIENNRRSNARDRDLNRDFQNARIGLISAWRKVIGDRQFDLTITLHEDYDAQGVYVYELTHNNRLAEVALEAARPFIPPDGRRKIDDSYAKQGVIRRKIDPDNFPLPGLPEAVYLMFHHTDSSLTIETPSEFSLLSRVEAHAAALRALIGE